MRLKWEEENNSKGASWCQVEMGDRGRMNWFVLMLWEACPTCPQCLRGDWRGLLVCLEQPGNLCASRQKDMQAEVKGKRLVKWDFSTDASISARLRQQNNGAVLADTMGQF